MATLLWIIGSFVALAGCASGYFTIREIFAFGHLTGRSIAGVEFSLAMICGAVVFGLLARFSENLARKSPAVADVKTGLDQGHDQAGPPRETG